MCHADFVQSAEVVAPILARSAALGVGQCVLEAIRATHAAIGQNTNLGIVLLIAPLSAVDRSKTLAEGIDQVLQRLTIEDAECVYDAIRIASPGGLGRAQDADIAEGPTGTLQEMMCLAADRDSVAAQYANGFSTILTFGMGILERHGAGFATGHGVAPTWETPVVRLHLELMAALPDTLIARKCGRNVAAESAEWADTVLSAGWPETDRARVLFSELDAWLRADGHRRNPGTTADLVAATLFAGFRDGKLPLPPGGAADIVTAAGVSD